MIIYNDSTLQSVWNMKLTRLKVFTFTSIASSLLVTLVIILIATTPLKEYIPGYPKKEYRQMLINNAIVVDSLENELHIKDVFIENIQTILEGDVPQNLSEEIDTTINIEEIQFQEYNHDSIFEEKIVEEQFNLSLHVNQEQNTNLNRIYFFNPVKGLVTNKFDLTTEHFGIDLVSDANSFIHAVLDGTVLFAGWTLDTGYILYIQHENNIVSVYKHNAELLKEAGDKVKAGEAIAIIGNSGELSTGPHLHFELWYNGIAVDPELYIAF